MFEPTSVEGYLWRVATHQGQISNERVREEIRSRDLGIGDVYIWFLIYQSSGNKLLTEPCPRMMSWGLGPHGYVYVHVYIYK
jgi:predicted secreted protein